VPAATPEIEQVVTGSTVGVPEAVHDRRRVPPVEADHSRAVYELIGEPPLFVGATHEIVTTPPAALAATAVGALGAPTTTIGADAALDAPVPATFRAATLNVYDVPAVRPVTVHVSAPVVVQVRPSGVEVTV
jgi:hypothetical protein